MLPQRVKKVYVSQDVFCTVEAPCHYALKIKSIKKSSVGISKCLRSLAAHPGSVVEQQLHLSTVNQGTQVQFPNPVGGGLLWPKASVKYQSTSLYLVDPEDHGILEVKGQLLGGTEGGETLHTGHHPFDADHLHSVGHHEGINHRHMGALQHTTNHK